jgi:polysaccharide biosynthesis protein PslH
MSMQPDTAGSPRPSAEDHRILVISRVGGPPPHRGNRTRMAALLAEMRRLGYQVHFAGVRMAAEEKAATRLLVDEWVGDFEVRRPSASLARLWSSLEYRVRLPLRYARWVYDRLDELFYDHWLGAARALQQQRQYARVLVPYVNYSKFFEAFPDPCLKILDAIDAFSNTGRQLRAKKVYWTSYSYSQEDETRGLLRAQRIIAIQAREAAYFRQLVGSACQVYTVGHLAESPGASTPPTPFPRLGYIGSRKNNLVNVQAVQWCLREIWPAVRKRLPNAELWLAGEAGETVEVAPGVCHLGPVPSLTDFYRDCPVLINPARRGTGLKIKTIEALMHGRPVITTSIGAEGLESFIGHGLSVCDSAGEFAKTAIGLLSDLPQARQLGEESLRIMRDYLAENRRVLAEALSS